MTMSTLYLPAFSGGVEAIDPETAADDELTRHRSELLHAADEAGFAAEYELFYSTVDSLEQSYQLSFYDFGRKCSSLSDDDLLEILGYLRKYVNAGQAAGYSAVSAAETFLKDTQYDIYDTFLVPDERTAISVFENGKMFLNELPDHIYYASEADVPNELKFTIALSPELMKAGETDGGAGWIVTDGGHYHPNKLSEDTGHSAEQTGNIATLTLSADDILSFAENGGFSVRVNAGGWLSEPCFIAIGTGAYFESAPSYFDKKSGRLSVDFNTDRLQPGDKVRYVWQFSSDIPGHVLAGAFDDSQANLIFETYSPTVSREDIEAVYPGETYWWDEAKYLVVSAEWEYDGKTRMLETPFLPVFGGETEEEIRALRREWTYRPVSSLETFGYNDYFTPGTVIHSNVFTLASDAGITVSLWHDPINGSGRVTLYEGDPTFTVPEQTDEHRGVNSYYVSYEASIPNGKTYQGGSTRLNVYPEDVLVYTGNGQSPGIFDDRALYQNVAYGTKKTAILPLEAMSLYHNGVVYSTGASSSSKKINATWYTNTTKSYEGATKFSTGSLSFMNTPDSYGEHYYYCVLTAGDFEYTSRIFTYNVIDPSSLEDDLYLITPDGTLYSVFSNKVTVTVPEKINGITVKTVAGVTFGTVTYGTGAYDRCPNMKALVLPDTVETLKLSSIPHNVTSLDPGSGLKYMENNCISGTLDRFVITENIEKLWLPKFRTLEIASLKAIDALNKSEYSVSGNGYIALSADKLILPEGLTVIGEGGMEFRVNVKELVLPSTLKVFAPTQAVYVSDRIELPEGLEVFDGGLSVEIESGHYTDVYADMNFQYRGSELVFPKSLKKLVHPGRLSNVTELRLPEGCEISEYFFASIGMESYTVPGDMTVIPEGLFMNAYLRELVIPEGVTRIGDRAFMNCTDLERVVIPSTVTEIGKGAFQGCGSLVEVIIEGPVTQIPDGAFSWCSSLESVRLPATVQRIGSDAFSGCGGLTSLDFLPDSVAYIGENAFWYSGISGRLELPEGLVVLKNRAFGETDVSEIVFGENLRMIGDGAFEATSVTDVYVPDSVTYIGREAFKDTPLETVRLGEDTVYIGAGAFAYTQLSSFEIPKKVGKLLSMTLTGTNITSIDLDPDKKGTLSYVGPRVFSATDITEIVFPDTITYIGRGVCDWCTSLVRAVLPNGLTRIRKQSFSSCTALTEVIAGSDLEYIGSEAFSGCEQLNGLDIPDGVSFIGDRAFYECASLEIEDLPSELTYVGEFAFASTKLAKIVIPDAVKSIGKGAFKNCAYAEYVVIGENVSAIGASAFEGCSLLEAIYIPDTVNSIGDHFIKDTAITVVDLPSNLRFIPKFTGNTVIKEVYCSSDGIERLWAGTFRGCTALETADVASGKAIGAGCFKDCVNLKYYKVSEETKTIGSGAFENCAALESVSFGDASALETIGEKAFSGCVLLTEIKLPEKLTAIGSRAFEKTSIKTVIVPSLVQSIGTDPVYNELSGTLTGYGDTCFYDCPELERIVFLERDGRFLPVRRFAAYCPKLAEVYFPASVGDADMTNGFDMDVFESGAGDTYQKYNEAKLDGYVPTAYYRYAYYDTDEDYKDKYTFTSLYKTGDTFSVVPFTSDYDQLRAWYDYYSEKAEECKNLGYPEVEVPALSDCLKPLTMLSDLCVKVTAGGEDVTDKVSVKWYVNWLDDIVLTEGASLAGSAIAHANFKYRFTVTLGEDYAFDYEDYESDEFVLTSGMENGVITVELAERPKGDVEIYLPDGVKDDESAKITVMQTQRDLLRILDTENVNGKITLRAAPSANLLVYVSCDGYYDFTGSIPAILIRDGIENGEVTEYHFDMEPLPRTGSFAAKFSIYDAVPEQIGGEKFSAPESFDGISVTIRNETKGTVCEDFTLQYPYIIINDYESFFELSDALTATFTPDKELEMYGFTAALTPGATENYGSSEGTFNRFGAIYVKPALPEDSESGRAIVQSFDASGKRLRVDIVGDGEILMRRYEDGTYTITVSEQNLYLNAVENLSKFTSFGWTQGEDYYRQTVTVSSPGSEFLEIDVPSAPDSSFLIKRAPVVMKEYKQFNRWWEYNWPYYTQVTFDVQIDLGYDLKNTKIVIGVPSDMRIFSIGRYYGKEYINEQMTYSSKYASDDGGTDYYEYDISDLSQWEGKLKIIAALEYKNDSVSFDKIKQQACTLTLVTDATVDGVTDRYFAPAGSVSLLDDEMLSKLVYLSHSPSVSDRKGITAQVKAPAGSEVDLYADGVLVAQGRTGYTGSAFLRYDAPFKWLWWEYEVYAVVRISNTGTEYKTEPVQVTFNEDLSSPVSVSCEVTIIDEETGKVVFPNEYDKDNVVYVDFKTGEKRNIKLRTLPDSSGGKTYRVIERYSAVFDNAVEGGARKVAVIVRWDDKFGNQKEEYLWTDFNEDEKCYSVTKNVKYLTFDPSTFLSDIQLPEYMGVEWDTAADSVRIVLMPGQLEAMKEREEKSEKSVMQILFGDDTDPQTAALRFIFDPVKNDPAFEFYPAAMQADIIREHMYVADFMDEAKKAFRESFGFDVSDITESDRKRMNDCFFEEAIDESVSAAELYADGYSEIPVYGMENGIFIKQTETGTDIYDFSAGIHAKYDSLMWLDVITDYSAAARGISSASAKKSGMRGVGTGDGDWDSLSKYVNGIHDPATASLIDTTYERYVETERHLDEDIISGVYRWGESLAQWLSESTGFEIANYMLGSKNPTINAVKDLVASVAAEVADSVFDMEWDKDRLINQYYDDDGNWNYTISESAALFLEENAYGPVQLVKWAANKATHGAVDTAINTAINAVTQFKDQTYTQLTKAYTNTSGEISEIVGKMDTNDLAKLDRFYLVVDEGEQNVWDAVQKGIANHTLKVSYTEDIFVQDPETGKLVHRLQQHVTSAYGSRSISEALKFDYSKGAEHVMIHRLINGTLDFHKKTNKIFGKVGGVGTLADAVTYVSGLVDSAQTLINFCKALDRMREDYGRKVEMLFEFASVYARYDEIVRATYFDLNEEKMERFEVYPVYTPELLEEFNFGSIVNDSYGNDGFFNGIFEGSPFLWMPAWVYGTDPETGKPVVIDEFYQRISLISYLSYYAAWGGNADSYFGDTYVYYAKEDLAYTKALMAVSKALADLVFRQSELCRQYDMELLDEASRIVNKLLGMLPFIGGLAEAVTNNIDDAVMIYRQRDAGFGDIVNRIYTTDTRIMADSACKTANGAIDRLKDVKEDIFYNGGNGGVWYKGPHAHPCVNGVKASGIWEKLVDEKWMLLYYYPSGHKDGFRWDTYGKESKVITEGDDADTVVDENGDIVGFYFEEGEMNSVGTGCSDPLIDPSGFVYEAVLSNRLEGVTVSIYRKDDGGSAVLWDAENYEQTSSVVTEKGGYYSWMTPPGSWKVVAEKEGYLTADTSGDINAVDGWLPVPPPQLNVNIGLVSTLSPTVKSANGYTEGVAVEFSQYMDITDLDGKVTLFVNGESVPAVITFIDAEASAVDPQIFYGRKMMISREDGEKLSGTARVIVSAGVRNYAGNAMSADFDSGELSVKQNVKEIKLDYDLVTVKTGDTAVFEGRLVDAFGDGVPDVKVNLSSDGTHAQLLNAFVYSDKSGRFTFTVRGTSEGFTVFTVSPETALAEAEVTAETVKMSPANKNAVSKSAVPEVTVIGPDGKPREGKITESGKITVAAGSKLSVSGNGKIGYSNTVSGDMPWTCGNYTGYTEPFAAESKTYRIAALEDGKSYSDVLVLIVEVESVPEHGHADENNDHNCDVCGEKISDHEDADNDHNCDICGEKISEHADSDNDHNCDVCGEKISEHADADNDHNCDICGEKISDHADSDNDHNCDICGEKISDHADADNDHNCDICGEKISEHADSDNDHNCDICGEKISDHADADNNHNCDVCGEKISEHADADNDHNCDICGEKISDHADSDNDHNCDICGEKISEHADSDSDHNCDVCGEKISDHADADNDHNCDVCGEKISDHADSDNDHNCDICGEKISEHADADNDHNCDICGAELEHSYSSDWNSDAEGHWHECSCGVKTEKTAHTPGAAATETTPQTCTVCGRVLVPALSHTHVFDCENTDEKYLKSPATCQSGAVYFYSCSCGEKGTETFTYGDPAGHDFGEWVLDPVTGLNKRTCRNCPVTESFVYGDVNGDGVIDTLDITRLRRYLAEEDVAVSAGADVNGDGQITLTDLTRLRRFLVGEEVSLGM